MSLAALLLLAAQHQHHPAMAMPAPRAEPIMHPSPEPKPPVGSKAATRTPAASNAPAVDHATMDHGAAMQDAPSAEPAMDHGSMDHSMHAAPPPPAPVAEASLRPAAGTGPAHAADAIWGADAMRASRDALRTMHGGQTYAWFQGDRFELRTGSEGEGYLWDLQGYYGGDTDKAFFKSEGEGRFGERAEQAEVQALWSHAIGPWFDLQTGIRHDFAGPDRTHFAFGVQGLAPYQFEIDAAAFVSDKGELSARVEGELDQRITQRLRLQPRAELNLSARDVPERGIGAGLDEIEIGLRLRYEIVREFAPYIGVEQMWRTGAGARYARAAGDRPSATHLVAGIRFWF